MIERRLREKLLTAQAMGEIESLTLGVLEELRREVDRLGYVAGIISSDGLEHVSENCRKLMDATAALRLLHDFPIFSSQDIFTSELYARLQPHDLAEENFRSLWSNILDSRLVTDVFFTPRWEESRGARMEHETAQKLGLRIFLP